MIDVENPVQFELVAQAHANLRDLVVTAQRSEEVLKINIQRKQYAEAAETLEQLLKHQRNVDEQCSVLKDHLRPLLGPGECMHTCTCARMHAHTHTHTHSTDSEAW